MLTLAVECQQTIMLRKHGALRRLLHRLYGVRPDLRFVVILKEERKPFAPHVPISVLRTTGRRWVDTVDVALGTLYQTNSLGMTSYRPWLILHRLLCRIEIAQGGMALFRRVSATHPLELCIRQLTEYTSSTGQPQHLLAAPHTVFSWIPTMRCRIIT